MVAVGVNDQAAALAAVTLRRFIRYNNIINRPGEMMNSKIKTRERVVDENQQAPKATVNLTTYKNYRAVGLPAKVDTTVIGGSRLKPQQPIRTTNPSRSTVGSKGFLSPGRNRELERIVLDSTPHDTLYLDVHVIFTADQRSRERCQSRTYR